MRNSGDIVRFIAARPDMMKVLDAVEGLGLRDCWVGAGFIRNAVWDRLHGREGPAVPADVDVVFLDAADIGTGREAEIEEALRHALPGLPWSARNQARMHARNGDRPYADMAEALRHWPERCTAVAARSCNGAVELLAPFGVADLLGLVVRPTPAFARKIDVYRDRIREKDWRRRWPRLTITEDWR